MATGTKARLPLSRERILRAALELADEGGIESISMRKLGHALGFEAMSLYNYVANKDEVLDGMLDLVLAESEPPAPSGAWQAAIREFAMSVHGSLRRHPWAAGLLMSPNRIRPARLQHMDALLGRLREAGFSAETTYHVYHVLDAHMIGFSLWQASHSYTDEQISDMAGTFDRLIPADEYPHLHEHGEQHLTEGPQHDVSAFEYGLDLILDGVKRIHQPA